MDLARRQAVLKALLVQLRDMVNLERIEVHLECDPVEVKAKIKKGMLLPEIYKVACNSLVDEVLKCMDLDNGSTRQLVALYGIDKPATVGSWLIHTVDSDMGCCVQIEDTLHRKIFFLHQAMVRRGLPRELEQS
jgi:hypothetical protein